MELVVGQTTQASWLLNLGALGPNGGHCTLLWSQQVG
jgi:hypothetical protein